MIHNAWANAWVTAVRTAVTDEAMLLAGHNDLAAGGIAHLALTPGKAAAMATARHSREEAHTVITLPVLTDEHVATIRAASSHCGHHRELRAGGLPDCLADPAHTGNVPMAPVAAEIGFACTCGMSPCRHAAALAHAVTRRLSTRPAAFAIIRGLSPQLMGAEATASGADSGMTTTRAAPGGKFHVTAHHAWAWYRECAKPPLVPDHAPSIPDRPVPAAPSWPTPPPPAPSQDQLHALLNDAAAKARSYLLSGTALECAWDDDAIRLASTVPRARIPEIADRLGLDIAQLRERLTS
ncbi:hypothetical protein [Streptomyces sp. 7N604]|uniref:hypothetical protein n=1 Tax=Streptomyces sp. 7N604 TaxID=3457415 RepID=UPI003FD40D1A